MAKFHINKHGVPAPCKAKPGNCPLGGDDTHFDNMKDAQAYADKTNEEKHSLLPGMNTNKDILKKLRDPISQINVTRKSSLSALMDLNKSKYAMQRANNAEDKRIAGYDVIEKQENYDNIQKRLEKQRKSLLEKYPSSLEEKTSINISEDNFKKNFPDTWYEHGFQTTGVSTYGIYDERWAEEFDEISKTLPKEYEVRNAAGISDILIKESNVASHVRNNIVSGTEGDQMYAAKEIAQEVLKNTENADYIDDEDGILKDGPLREDIESFIGEEMVDSSTLSINGEKFYVESIYPSDKTDSVESYDWGRKYFDSGRYDEFLSKQGVN